MVKFIIILIINCIIFIDNCRHNQNYIHNQNYNYNHNE